MTIFNFLQNDKQFAMRNESKMQPSGSTTQKLAPHPLLLEPPSLQLGSLKKTTTNRKLFENLDSKVNLFTIKSPTVRMRFIDTLRFHKPNDDERQQFQLCDSIERLYMHKLSDILIVCGARKGARFKSQHIQQLRTILKELEENYEFLDSFFQLLPVSVCHFKFTSITVIEEDVELLQKVQRILKQDIKPKRVVEMYIGEVEIVAALFQYVADQYIQSFQRLRAIVDQIRKESYPQVIAQMEDGIGLHQSDPEFDSKIKHPFPIFLLVLIQKYRREHQKNECLIVLEHNDWTPDSTDPPVDSLAIFSNFLACALIDSYPCTTSEYQSFSELLRIILCSFSCKQGEENCSSFHPWSLTSRNLAFSIWEFLCTVRELKVIPKDKEIMMKPQRYQK